MTSPPPAFAPNPMSYLWDEVAAYQALGEAAYNDIVNAPANALRDIIRNLNAQVNSAHPIARAFMDRAIDDGGDVVHGPGTAVASAIARSDEFRDLIRDMASATISTPISFRRNLDLSRSIHDGSLTGTLDVTGNAFTFAGSLRDTYDFRYDLLPKSWTWRGVGLRIAGNLAKACTDVGLLSPYAVVVDLRFSGSK